MIHYYVVYDHPKDYPDRYVIREWHGNQPKEVLFESGDLDVIRGFLTMRGLVNIGKFDQHDSTILEIWI